MSAPALTDISGGSRGGHFGSSRSTTAKTASASALAAVNPYAAIVLAGIQIWSGNQQASDARFQARMQRKIDEENAKYIEYDAWQTEKHGYTMASRYASVVDDVVGKQLTGFAAAGVDVKSGTAAELIKESKLIGFLNAAEMQNQARAQALGLKMQASSVRLGAEMGDYQAGREARSYQLSGYLGAAETAVRTFK